MIRYDIHQLVEVFVDPATNPQVRDDIDFQLAHFRVNDAATTNARQLRVVPYEQWSPADHTEMFHEMKHRRGEFLDDPSSRFAIQRQETGFTVFTEWRRFVLNLLLQTALLEQDLTFVHAAGVVDDHDRVTLLPGPGGVGKTALVGELVSRGYRLLGDDLVLLRADGECLAFPRPFVLKSYHRQIYGEVFDRLGLNQPGARRNRQAWWRTALFHIYLNLPFRELMRQAAMSLGMQAAAEATLTNIRPRDYIATVPVEEIFGAETIATHGRLHRIVFMERTESSTFGIESFDRASLAKRMVAIIHHEWASDLRLWLAMGAVELLNLPGCLSGADRIIRQAIADADSKVMRIPANATPRDLSACWADRIETQTTET